MKSSKPPQNKKEKLQSKKEKPENDNDAAQSIRRLTWKSFTVGGLVSILLISAWSWIKLQPQSDGIPWILRSALELNGKIWSKFFSLDRLTSIKSPAPGTPLRLNGEIGLSDPIKLAQWKLKVFVEDKWVQDF